MERQSVTKSEIFCSCLDTLLQQQAERSRIFKQGRYQGGEHWSSETTTIRTTTTTEITTTGTTKTTRETTKPEGTTIKTRPTMATKASRPATQTTISNGTAINYQQ